MCGVAIESGVCAYKLVGAGILGTPELRIAKPCAWFRKIDLRLYTYQYEERIRLGLKQKIRSGWKQKIRPNMFLAKRCKKFKVDRFSTMQ